MIKVCIKIYVYACGGGLCVCVGGGHVCVCGGGDI